MATYEVPSLPYKYSALEPYIDEDTMRIHHTKHHQAYVDKLNAALEKHPNLDLFAKPLEEILSQIDEVPEDVRQAVRNHGGGHYNHSFFWNIMASAPDETNAPTGLIAAEFEDQFGGFDVFRDQFISAAAGVFGSGWAWLIVNDDNKLEIVTSSNQDTPIMFGKRPILGVDVWEHAYYLRYQNLRPTYVEGFFHVVNWHAVNDLLKKYTQQ